jgi:hypothetical protein
MQGLDEFAWKFVDNRVEFFLLLGYQVTVKPLQTQIPDEYIGLIIHRDEGCRCTEWKEYLGIKVESVKKGIPVFRRIRPSDIPVAPTVWDKYPPTEYTPKV